MVYNDQGVDQGVRAIDQIKGSEYLKNAQLFLEENNAIMNFETSGTKAEMHQWQHEKILEWKACNNGCRPRLNKSDY